MKIESRRFFSRTLNLTAIACGVFVFTNSVFAADHATGIVFDDKNRNGKLDTGEKGLPGVYVSNQREVATTDVEGRWSLPADDDTIFFVIKPSGWMVPLNNRLLPQFYYSHKPAGSPKSKFAGVAPTGPLPKSINFPLHKQKEPEKFQAIFFGDPQPRSQEQIDYIAHDVIEGLIGTDAKFGVTLGDILFDDLSLFDSYNATVALVGIPWFSVIGNHDINRDAKIDSLSDETFQRHYGPAYYSFDYGKVHFIVLDNVDWNGKKYRGGLGADQIEFVKNDLKRVPEKQLVVLMMHIPLIGTEDRGELYRLIENRPYTLSISGHTHTQEHHFIGKADGWKGKKPHHHIINVTVSGTWWKGQKDETGIPHATMRDGAPNGHSVITFDGHKATFEFRAARAPADYQMNVIAPELIAAKDLAKTDIYVNVFAGSEKTKVEMRVGKEGGWTTTKKTTEIDPWYAAVREREQALGLEPALNAPRASTHLWKGKLPGDLHSGTHTIYVRATNMYGKVFNARRIVRVK